LKCVIQLTVTGLTVDIISKTIRIAEHYIGYSYEKHVQNFTEPYISYVYGQCVETPIEPYVILACLYATRMCTNLYKSNFANYNPSPIKYLQKTTLFHFMLIMQ